MIRLVQISEGYQRRVAVVDEPHLRLLHSIDSVYALANAAIRENVALSAIILLASAVVTKRLRAAVSELASIHNSSPAETTMKPSPNCSNNVL